MIDLHYWPTPNGWKISIALEELALPYRVVPVNIGRGDQFREEFLAISPNNRIPAIVDHAPLDAGPPISVFESGAILVYLAEKTGRLLPAEVRARTRVLEWVFWQVGGLGPMAGQANHFKIYAPERLPYAVNRYMKEFARLLSVLDRALSERRYVAGDDYSIADIATWPWVTAHEHLALPLDPYPHVRRWFELVGGRAAVRAGRDVGKELRAPLVDEEARKHLFKH